MAAFCSQNPEQMNVYVLSCGLDHESITCSLVLNDSLVKTIKSDCSQHGSKSEHHTPIHVKTGKRHLTQSIFLFALKLLKPVGEFL